MPLRAPLASVLFVLTVFAATPTFAGDEVSLPAGVSADWFAQVQQELADREYDASAAAATPFGENGRDLQAPNRAQDLRTYFGEDGVRLVRRSEDDPSWCFSMRLVGVGRGGTLAAPASATRRANGNRVTYERGELTEWYVNDRKGLEQGFTLAVRPAGPSTAPLCLAIDLGGDLVASVDHRGARVELATAAGEGGAVTVLHLSELVAWDDAGRDLPAHFERDGTRLLLTVDDRDAVYPIVVDPLASSPAWTAEGNQASAAFGWSASGAGDVNGDGYSDVIIGAFTYDNGEVDEGRAFVYHGSGTGLVSAPAWTAESDQASAWFGVAVSTAGDVNGDGYSDVIIAARLFDGDQSDEGRVSVFHGSPAGLSALPVWTADGNQAGANFGTAVSTAGDVNGDGYSDVIIGARNFDNGEAEEGRAFVYIGSPQGLAAAPSWTAESDQAVALFGDAVSAAGDVNGDGYADVIVGAPWYDNGETDEGGAFVYLGTAAGPAASAAWTAESDQVGASMVAVSTAGDVNGDGYSDVIVGASKYQNGQYQEGAAFVYHGSSIGLAATSAWMTEGDQAGARFGNSVSTAGDVNGDGYADVIIGAFLYTEVASEGAAFVYQGSAAGLSTSPALQTGGFQPGAQFGVSVATAGDVNGDGFSDVLVGAPSHDSGEVDEGRVYVYHGSSAGLSLTEAWSAEGVQAGQALATSVASAGDVNGDGYADVIVGVPYYSAASGIAMVYHGSPSGLATAASWVSPLFAASYGAYFGFSVSGVGDVNGDGYADVIIGAQGHAALDTEGSAYVFHGSSTGLGSIAIWSASGGVVKAQFGWSVSGAGDVNGDGYADAVVGAPGFSNGEAGEGRALVYYGSSRGLSPTAAWTVERDQANAGLGTSVSTAGDVNGDGYADVVVGAPQYDGDLVDEGEARVYHGSAAGLSLFANWAVEGDQSSASLGHSVSTAGDVNGDGYADVIAGAPYYNSATHTGAGAAYVWYGSAAGLSPTPAWSGMGANDYDAFGWSASTAGDVNGDGHADVVVGAISYSNGESQEGGAFVYHGSLAGLSAAPDWAGESNLKSGEYGASVGSAGDVNGDGYADMIAGAPRYDAFKGRAYVYLGNEGPGLSLNPRQRRADADLPIAHRGVSPHPGFAVALLGRSPFGRSKVGLQWEVSPVGSATPTASGMSASWTDTGVADAELSASTPVLGDGLYHWRARLVYHPATTPFQPASRWLRLTGGGALEADLRVLLMPAVLSLDDASAIDVTYQKGASAPAPFLRQISNIGTAGLSWTSTTDPAAPWLVVSPGFGSGQLPSDMPAVVSIGIDAAAPVGVHATTLRFQNTFSPGNGVDVPVMLQVVGSPFVPGDQLLGDLGAIGGTTGARFDGIKGMALKLTFLKSSSAMKSLVTVRDKDLVVVSQWKVNHKKKTKKTAVLAEDGAHTVTIQALSGTPGPFAINTGRGLPKAAKKFSKTKKGSGEPKTAAFPLAALPGTIVSAKLVPKKGFTGPMELTVIRPDGSGQPVTTQALANGGLSVDALIADLPGTYVFEVQGFQGSAEKVLAVVKPVPPPSGSQTVILP